MVFFIGACAYEPKTIVKTPRASHIQMPLNNKKITSVKPKLNVLLADKVGRIEKQIPPIIGIDLSNFKRNLIGLDKLEIIELLDKPAFERTEHPASIWQYKSSHCIIDIFFYSKENDFVVDHVEIRSNGIKMAEEKQCFSSFLDAKYKEKK